MTTFSDLLTFSRSGSATYVDSTGTLQTAADGEPRTGHHVWDGSQWVNEGLLIESESRTQLLHGTDSLPTQTESVSAQSYTLSFRGTGSIALTGAHTDTLAGTGENDLVSLTFTPSAGTLTITPSGTITQPNLEVGETPSSHIPNTAGSGSVTRAAETLTAPSANLPWWTDDITYLSDELVTNGTFDSDTDWTKGTGWTISGGTANKTTTDNTSIFQNIVTVSGNVYAVTFDVVTSSSGAGVRIIAGGSTSEFFNTVGTYTVFFTASSSSTDVFFSGGSFNGGSIDNISVREIKTPAVSIAMEGTMTYADEGAFLQVVQALWRDDTANQIILYVSGSGSAVGTQGFLQENASVTDTVSDANTYSPGVNVPFSIASRHGSTFVNGAVDGTALTENDTPTALPDLSSTDLEIAPEFMGTIKSLRIWADDLGDSGIEEASS